MYRHILRGPNKLNMFLRDNSSIRHSQCETSFFAEITSRLSGVLISWVMFKLPAWSEKSNLFIAVRLQVGRVFDQTVVEAAVVALVEALATGFVHKRHEVHLKHSRGGKLIYSVQTSCTAWYLWIFIYIHIYLTLSFICCKACTCFHTELGYLWYFSIIFYWIIEYYCRISAYIGLVQSMAGWCLVFETNEWIIKIRLDSIINGDMMCWWII